MCHGHFALLAPRVCSASDSYPREPNCSSGYVSWSWKPEPNQSLEVTESGTSSHKSWLILSLNTTCAALFENGLTKKAEASLPLEIVLFFFFFSLSAYTWFKEIIMRDKRRWKPGGNRSGLSEKPLVPFRRFSTLPASQRADEVK